jgi:hypothetical protein
MNRRLRILCDQQYIGRHYDSNNRQHAPYAIYFLRQKGIAYLKQFPSDFQQNVLRNMRMDRKQSPSSRFVRHSLSIFTAYTQLARRYGTTFKFYTKSYLSLPAFDSLPDKRPDAFAAGSFGTSTVHQYIIECLDDTMPYSVMKQKIARLVDHADSGIWPTKPYPTLLFMCQTEQLQMRVQQWCTKIIADSWAPDLAHIVATSGDINLHSTSDEHIIQPSST